VAQRFRSVSVAVSVAQALCARARARVCGRAHRRCCCALGSDARQLRVLRPARGRRARVSARTRRWHVGARMRARAAFRTHSPACARASALLWRARGAARALPRRACLGRLRLRERRQARLVGARRVAHLLPLRHHVLAVLCKVEHRGQAALQPLGVRRVHVLRAAGQRGARSDARRACGQPAGRRKQAPEGCVRARIEKSATPAVRMRR
jgi:hypothetical protein